MKFSTQLSMYLICITAITHAQAAAPETPKAVALLINKARNPHARDPFAHTIIFGATGKMGNGLWDVIELSHAQDNARAFHKIDGLWDEIELSDAQDDAHAFHEIEGTLYEDKKTTAIAFFDAHGTHIETTHHKKPRYQLEDYARAQLTHTPEITHACPHGRLYCGMLLLAHHEQITETHIHTLNEAIQKRNTGIIDSTPEDIQSTLSTIFGLEQKAQGTS